MHQIIRFKSVLIKKDFQYPINPHIVYSSLSEYVYPDIHYCIKKFNCVDLFYVRSILKNILNGEID